MIVIKEAKFVKGILGSNEILEIKKKQVAFWGKSNSGKSSFINSILGRVNLVKSSSKPGKTTEINFFDIFLEKNKKEENIFFVDLPGYGYAKLSDKLKIKIQKLLNWYLEGKEVFERLNILIVDSRRGLTEFDKILLSSFKEKKEDFLIILSKSDKLNQKQKSQIFQTMKKEFSEENFLFYSVLKNKDKEKNLFWQKIFSFIHS